MYSRRRLELVILAWVIGLIVLPWPATAARKTFQSTATGVGAMSITGDQYGTFGPARFTATDGSSSFIWQYFGSLMLTDGTDNVWLADQNEWSIFECCRGRVNLLPDADLVSDTVEAARRTSQFRVSRLDNLGINLVQEMPEAGYNFVQTYTFTNPTAEPMSLKMVLFNDQDHGGNDDIHDDRIGFVSGEVPRMYFIEDQEVAGPGDPGVDDRPTRISVITQPGPGLHYDGYLGITRQSFAFDLVYYLAANRGIGDEFRNSIQVAKHEFLDATPTGESSDQDGDGLSDSHLSRRFKTVVTKRDQHLLPRFPNQRQDCYLALAECCCYSRGQSIRHMMKQLKPRPFV
jgi:hypothetical protein